jgi:beta-glucanase (GH16 family)
MISLTLLLGLLIFSPLVSCASGGNHPATQGAKATPTLNATSTTATATPSPSPWTLVWDSEFNGPAGAPPDSSKWSPITGGEGWGNEQLDYDTNNQNVYQDGQGNLVIEARKGNPNGYSCWYGPCTYTSGQISTQGHFSFTYGLIEARIKIPAGQGLWSAFWLLGANYPKVNWPECGEIDVMENIGNEPNIIYGTVHGPGYSSGNYKLPSGIFADGFHTFALQWDPNHLYFIVDGITYHTVTRSSFPKPSDWVYDHSFNIILNLPVGGSWPGNPNASTHFPQQMLVSYVKVYTPA